MSFVSASAFGVIMRIKLCCFQFPALLLASSDRIVLCIVLSVKEELGERLDTYLDQENPEEASNTLLIRHLVIDRRTKRAFLLVVKMINSHKRPQWIQNQIPSITSLLTPLKTLKEDTAHKVSGLGLCLQWQNNSSGLWDEPAMSAVKLL